MVYILLLTAVHRTRQNAVFLCLFQADMIQPILGGAIGTNTKPMQMGNTLSRLLAVVEPRHFFMAKTKLTGGIIMSKKKKAAPAPPDNLLYFPKKSKDECDQLLCSVAGIVFGLSNYGDEACRARTITRGGIAQVLLQGLADLGYDYSNRKKKEGMG